MLFIEQHHEIVDDIESQHSGAEDDEFLGIDLLAVEKDVYKHTRVSYKHEQT